MIRVVGLERLGVPMLHMAARNFPGISVGVDPGSGCIEPVQIGRLSVCICGRRVVAELVPQVSCGVCVHRRAIYALNRLGLYSPSLLVWVQIDGGSPNFVSVHDLSKGGILDRGSPRLLFPGV